MAHPPPRPATVASAESITPWGWLQHVQVAAAVLLARYAEDDEPWPASQRRQALLALAHGPTDWTTTAACVALTETALQCPETTAEIRLFLLGLLLTAGGAACCFRVPLAKCLLRLPDLRPDIRAQLVRL